MTDIYLLRHAIAVERGTPGYEIDRTRPLTPEGARRMRRIAEGMLNLKLDFDVVLTSPYLRAKQTADIVGQVLRPGKGVQVTDALSPGGDQARLVEDLGRQFGDAKGVMLVGHEPDLSELASTLSSGSLDVALEMKKGGLCLLQAEKLTYGQCATLKWLLTPAQLRRLA